MGKKKIPEEGIYDARQLGAGRMFVLGFQHMFAMFGATVLVPILTGLDVSTTLLFAGLGTLLFHLITGGIVPAFLGSSFAFLGGYATIAPMIDGQPNHEMLPYACFGVACAGLVYVVLSALFKAFGAKKVMRFFPPIVTGPIIIAIGLNLSSSAINNCAQNWWIAMVAIGMAAGCIPIAGYNIGAKKTDRARALFSKLLLAEFIVGAVALVIVEVFPLQIAMLFGAANESTYYADFTVKCFRTYLCLMPLATLNKGTFIYLQALGKAFASTAVSMTREIIFGVSLPVILPVFFGLDGLLWSFPAADLLTFLIAAFFIRQTYRELSDVSAVHTEEET